MTDRENIKPWKPTDPPSAKHLNKLVKSANRSLSVGSGLRLLKTSGGDVISLSSSIPEIWIGTIAASDDVSASDWSDNRHFVHKQRITSSDGESDIVGHLNDIVEGSDWHVATNLFSSRHDLKSGDTVLVFSVLDNQRPTSKQHVMFEAPRGDFRWGWAKQNWSSDAGYGGAMVRAYPVTGIDAKENADSDNEFTALIHTVHDKNGNIYGTPNLTSGMYFGYMYDNKGEAWIHYPPSVVQDGIIQKSVRFWMGDMSTMPAGWQFCDGENGTNDFRGKFPVGAYSDTGYGIPSANCYIGPEEDYNCIGETPLSHYLMNVFFEHAAYTPCLFTCCVTAGADMDAVYDVGDITIALHSDYFDLRPPRIVVGFIQRSDNSIPWTE